MPQTLKDEVVANSPQGAGTAAPTAVRSTLASRAEESGRPQPVCLEVPVTVNGVRTQAGTNKREPFTETTSSVIVFARGAVLRLSVALNPGQLLFLTNERTKKETVCQVVKSRNYKNVNGYIEIEFTEPVVGFWGMRFPGDPIGSQSTPAASVSRAREEQHVLGPDPAASVSVSNLQRASDVKPAVPAVKMDAPVSEAAPAASSSKPQPVIVFPAPALAVPSAPPVEVNSEAPALLEPVAAVPSPRVTEKIAPVHQEETESSQSLPAIPPAAQPKPAEARSFSVRLEEEGIPVPSWFDPTRSGSATPVRREPAVTEEKHFSHEAEPAVVPVAHETPYLETYFPAPSAERKTSKPAAEKHIGRGLAYGAIAAVLLLAAVSGGFLYFRGKASAPGHVAAVYPASTLVPASLPAAPPAPLASTPASAGTVAGANSAVGSNASAAGYPNNSQPAAVISRESAAPSPKSTSAISGKEPPASKKAQLPKLRLSAPIAAHKVVSAASSDSDAGLSGNLEGAPIAGDPAANSFLSSHPAAPVAPKPESAAGGEFKPAHVISTVVPIYPSLARSQNVSGDVVVDAEIGPDGKVGKVKVLSGPMLLHQAAKDALSKWKYAPAMLDGKPTEMHVSVTLRFRLQ